MTELIYIDEEPREARRVYRFAVTSGYFTEEQVEYMAPLSSLDETVEAIFASGCSAVITDYQLGEKVDNVDYTGTDLISRIRDSSRNFPCFITTSYPEDAIKTDVDSFNVFFKEDIHETNDEDGPRITFFQRVRQSIERKRLRLEDLSSRHTELTAIITEREMTPAELEEFIEIDSELEEDLSFDTASSVHAKKVAFNSFEVLVEDTKALIQDLKSELASDDRDGSDG